MTSLLTRVRRRRGRPARQAAVRRPPLSSAHEDIAADLPDEDLGEDLSDALDLYVHGSKPRCEEAEYLELMQEAIDRIAREG
jgi:hypothetical protein